MTFLVDQRAKSTRLSVEKEKGAVSPKFVSLQVFGALEVEERGYQDNLPTQTLRHNEDNKTDWGLSREERRFLKEAKGSQTKDKGSLPFPSG